MKKLQRLFMLAALFLPFAVNAQLSAIYQFSTGIDNTQWYTLTSDSTVLKVGSNNDSYATPVTDIGFTFNFAGVDYTQFSANSDGTVRLGSTVIGTGYYTTPFSATNANNNTPKICGLGCDGYMVSATADSPADYIAYQVFGSDGDHVLVIEISTGTYSDATRNNHYTFQIQLAEVDNSVTLIYSPTAPAAGPAVTYQLGACTSASDIVLFNVANNTMSTYTSGTSTNNASGTWPAPGRYYTITPDPNACYPVTGLTASNITATGATLTWADTNNTGATYSVYNGETLLASGITGYTYDVTGLSANASYVFYVIANCSGDNASNAANVSIHSACGPTSLPWTCGFEENEIVSTTAATALPWCSERYVSPAATSGTTYPYSYNTNAHTGSRSLYFFGTTGSAYPDTMAIILPEIDVTNYPMSGNRVTFWARMGAASNSKNVYVGTMTNPTDMTTFSLVDSVIVSGNTYTLFSVPLTTASETAPYVALMVLKGTGTMYIDDVTFEEMPSCVEVTNLAVTGVTSSSVTLSWTDAVNAGASYTIYNMADSSVAGTTSGTTYTVDNLNSNTVYTFGVQTNCTSGDAAIMTISERTSCSPEALPFSETFDASLSSDPCWTGATGTTAAEVFNGATLTLSGISAGYWNYSSSQNGFNDGHYYCNIYGTSRKSWMITPAIDLTTATTAQLSFDMALTAYSGTMQQPATYTGGQKFMVIVSADGGNTWLESNATVWMRADSNANYAFEDIPYDHYGNYVINLDQYLGNTIKIAFYGESTVTGGDNNFHIDNIAVTEVPSCPSVTGVTLDGTTASTADIHWNGNGAAGYEVQVTQNGVVVTDATVSVTDTTAVISGLTVDNDYQVEVRSICGSDYGQWSNPLSIHIGYCTPNPTSVDGSGIASVAFGGMTNTTHPTSPGFADYTSMSGTVSAGLPATVEITYATGYTYGTIIWVDWNNSLSFEGDEVVYAGESESTNPTTLVATFDVPATTPMGSYRMRILGADSYFDNYTGSLAAAANANPCASYTWGVAEDYTLTVGAAPSCLPVTNLTVSDVTSSVVSLTWTDENNTGATYTVYNMADSSVVASGISTTNYDVTGLAASTSYTFGVVTNCSATDASGFVTVDATTECLGGNCQISIVGVDSWGDGWNGNAINVIQNGVTIGTFTIASGSSNTETYSVCSSYPVSFSWVLGSYPGETSFDILINGSFAAYSGSGSDLNDGEVFFTLAEPCPSCMPVTDLNVDNTTENSIAISWTGSAASYDVYKDGVFVANVTTTTYTFNGLAATTAYTLGVQAICSVTDSASMVTVEASTSCPDVTTLPYNEGFENGLGCWMTINASSDGQPWTVNNCSGLSNVNPHGGAYVASSWSWSSSAMHANAWLISPKFVLPNATDSLSFSWWEITNPNYHDSYSVVLSTTTNDTAAFTTVLRPYDTAAGTWTMQTVDLTPYAGQSVYIAFHHVDYDENYLLIDDIALYQGAYIPPAPDSLTVVFAVNDATMGTTVPAPGTYQYLMGDTVAFHPQANTGYHFTNWVMSAGGQSDTLAANYVSVYFIVNGAMMSYGTVTMTALFEADSTPVTDALTINLSINNPALGTIDPLPGIYHVALNDSLVLTATPNPGVNFDGWKMMIGGQTLATVPINPFTLPVNQNNITFGEMTIVAMFNDGSSAPDSITVIVNTADATMGTTNPAPGTYHYAVGSESFLAAIPNPGYHNLYWIEEFAIAGMVEYDTLYVDTVNLTVVPMMAGVTLSITAYFEANAGEPCETPTYLAQVVITKEVGSIHLTWVDNAGVSQWNLQYRPLNGDWTTVVVTGMPEYAINGLENGAQYEVRVQAVCGDGVVSEWTPILLATATNSGIDSWLENSVSLYPNPAKEYVDIRVDGDLNVKMMEVYDVYGKLINTVMVTENPTRINVSSLANGMYFVRVSTEAGMVTKTFIKK
ncbi:MAG: choice-of-anchor J domain-containing protein [Bacteroidales bacterium]|nr:choice-of-anchor J domain-containing protein [Bacteroidales bacterium]